MEAWRSLPRRLGAGLLVLRGLGNLVRGPQVLAEFAKRRGISLPKTN